MTAGACIATHRTDPARARGVRAPSLICLGCEKYLQLLLAGADDIDAGGRVRGRRRGLPELFTELEEALPPAGGKRPGGGGGLASSSPLPYQPVVSDHRHAIAETLTYWAHAAALMRGETELRNPTPARAAAWLADRLDWLIQQPAVAKLVDEFAALRGRALALLDPVHRARVTVAWCASTGTDCPGLLIAQVATNDSTLPAVITCDTCDATWRPATWHRLGRMVEQTPHRPVPIRREAV